MQLRDNSQRSLMDVLSIYETGIAHEPYLPWDQLRYRTPPGDFSHEEWWFAIKTARQGLQRRLPLKDPAGNAFVYSLPDEVLRENDFISAYGRGRIGANELVTNPATRDRYLVSSLIEEAITSSQLEGASTEREVAKQMLRSGRKPNDRSERMILNNYRAMQELGRMREEALTPELICEIHRIVTEGTLDDPTAAGRFQRSDEQRIAIFDEQDNLLHRPPSADVIPERMARLCEFANASEDSGVYLPGVLRALTIHFMVGYEHPFEDGNGRTARVLFYWAMLRQGYWVTEFLSVSRILKNAPAKYARSFLYTETDDNDLTYFFSYHLGVIRRAIDDLHGYLARKADEVASLKNRLANNYEMFNNRQIALLQHAFANPGAVYSVQSHKTSHRVTTETARQDLRSLEARHLLVTRKVGKKFLFHSADDLADKVASLGNSSEQLSEY